MRPRWWAFLLAGVAVAGWLLLISGHTLKMAVHATLAAAGQSYWEPRLYVPTFMTRLGGRYFLVDCWHNRVLYSDNLEAPIGRWRVLDADLAGPHSVASDGVLYVVDDTGRNLVRVYKPVGDGFQRVETITGLGTRPHRVRYDEATSAFFVLTAGSQQISKLVRHGDRLETLYTKELPFLKHTNTRTFSIDGGAMYFSSGPGAITKVRYLDDSYEVLATYPVPDGLSEMNDLFFSGGYVYMTAAPAQMVRVRSLEMLHAGQAEDVYSALRLRGTPYSMSEMNGRIYVTLAAEDNGVRSFAAAGDAMKDVQILTDFGPPTFWDRQARSGRPK